MPICSMLCNDRLKTIFLWLLFLIFHHQNISIKKKSVLQQFHVICQENQKTQYFVSQELKEKFNWFFLATPRYSTIQIILSNYTCVFFFHNKKKIFFILGHLYLFIFQYWHCALVLVSATAVICNLVLYHKYSL